MAKRHDDALAIQAGACNPTAISLALVAACREIAAQPNYKGTAHITSDPALRLMVHQLAFICQVTDAMPEYAELMQKCRDELTASQTAP